ncbi:MAG: pinensin family lanthipeptide [Cyclobacteriaceae bacterium]
MKKLNIKDLEVTSFVTDMKEVRGGAEACTTWPDPACETMQIEFCNAEVQ